MHDTGGAPLRGADTHDKGSRMRQDREQDHALRSSLWLAFRVGLAAGLLIGVGLLLVLPGQP
jgi:hypothetical protein